MSTLVPGTYRIVNVKSGTALTVSDGDTKVLSGLHKWLVQRSGDRYRFKNHGTGQYLTVPNPENAADVYGGKHPASWDLDHQEQNRDSYIDYARVLDLDGWGAGYNGNHVHMTPQLEWMPHRSWRFERLGDEPGEENLRLHKQIAERDQQLVERDQQLAVRNRRLAELEQQLAQTDRHGQTTGVGVTEEAKRPIQLHRRDSSNSDRELVDQSTLLEQTQEALRRANETIRDRDITILTLRNELLSERTGHETSRQAREIADLRKKVESIEGRLEEVRSVFLVMKLG
ncbi:hypothetical protein FRC07_007750 [Ceratobasidium sp. 392]|nr:hypothetical protein FRC07_007750 [Ceratobasidium sp. 392]